MHGWSVPGMIPKNYERYNKVDILVGQLYSPRTSMAFDFYSLPWCNNTVGGGYDAEKRGSSLIGTPLIESPYQYRFNNDKNMPACHKVLTNSEIQSFSFYMQHNFTYNL